MLNIRRKRGLGGVSAVCSTKTAHTALDGEPYFNYVYLSKRIHYGCYYYYYGSFAGV